MSRTQRLFELIQILRRHRYPISGKELASQLNISLRTLYRDIASLQAQGAEIEGEPGLGYVLRPSFMLPPLMFNEEELEALVLGSRWVAKKTDSKLSNAAKDALAKIAAVLPQDLRLQLELSSLLIGPSNPMTTNDEMLISIRKAIRSEQKVEINYTDLKESQSQRVIWPLGIGFFEQIRIIIAWCEFRQDFRHFRVDRINELEILKDRYPERKHTLIQQWRDKNNIKSNTRDH